MNLSFERYKVERFLERNGSIYTFYTPKLNSFNEPEGEDTPYPLRGVYHERHIYLGNLSSDGGTVRDKTPSRILCSYTHYHHLKSGMNVTIDQTHYKVTGVQDLNHLHVACDISLEEVLS